jgi:RpiB/LacA/LacB family sugar-phosphate isomerase
MKIAIGADHAGFDLKERVKAHLRLKHQAEDLGTHSIEQVDYPDFAEAVDLVVCNGKSQRGVLICRGGAGASVVANKAPGIRDGVAQFILNRNRKPKGANA